MTKIFGINFAPLNLPLRRRLQTLSALLFYSQLMILGFFGTFFLIFLLFTPFFIIPLIYFSWIIYDRNTFNQGGRPLNFLRNNIIWKLFAEYFPVHLHKTADLTTDKNYVLGFHPHGIMANSAIINFGSNATGFNKLFPNIKARLITLEMNFWIPFHREFLLFNGFSSANAKNIEYILSKKGKGNAVVIVVGGADEALEAIPGRMELVLKNRKGFVRLALKHGASLVPVISFGENEVFKQTHHDDNDSLKIFQRTLKRFTRFSTPIFHGRGIFQYTFGLLPYRRPIHTIVGKPIEVPKIVEPSKEDIDKYHSLYMNDLINLFNEHKVKYAYNKNMEIYIK